MRALFICAPSSTSSSILLISACDTTCMRMYNDRSSGDSVILWSTNFFSPSLTMGAPAIPKGCD